MREIVSLWTAAIGITALAGLMTIGTTFVYPAAAAAICPTCYGLDPIGSGVFMERGATAAEESQARRFLAQAFSQVRAFYGPPIAEPRVLICRTNLCYQKLGGGGSLGRTLVDQAVFLAPLGANSVIASHELSHVQIHSRIGALRTLMGSVPEWFVEGVAVVVSDDRRYLAPLGSGDRCLVAPDGPLPASLRGWMTNARSQQLYAKAGCQVSRWMDARGGSRAVVRLLDQIAHGVPFEAAYNEKD